MKKTIALIILLCSCFGHAQPSGNYAEFQKVLVKLNDDIKDGSLDSLSFRSELLKFKTEIDTLAKMRLRDIKKINGLNKARELMKLTNWLRRINRDCIEYKQSQVESGFGSAPEDTMTPCKAYEETTKDLSGPESDTFVKLLEIGVSQESKIEFRPGGVGYLELSQGGAFTERFSYFGDITYSFLHTFKDQKNRLGLQIGALTDGFGIGGTIGPKWVRMLKPIEDKTLGSLANLQLSSALLYSIASTDNYDQDIIFNLGVGVEAFKKFLVYIKADYNFSENFFIARAGIGISFDKNK